MLKEEKEETIARIKEELKATEGLILVDYRGLNVHQISDLRKKLREAGVEFKVVKNTLFRRAASESGLEPLLALLVGPTAAAFSHGDLIASAKLLSDFAKEHEVLKIKGGVLNGEVIGPDKVKMLASLPAIEVLYAKILGSLKDSMFGLVNVLSNPSYRLVTVLKRYSEQQAQTV